MEQGAAGGGGCDSPAPKLEKGGAESQPRAPLTPHGEPSGWAESPWEGSTGMLALAWSCRPAPPWISCQ